MHSFERHNRETHSRRIAFKPHPVSRTPSPVKRLRTKLATRLVIRFTTSIFATGSIPADEIGPAPHLRQQFRNVGRIVLQTPIHQNNCFAAGCV